MGKLIPQLLGSETCFQYANGKRYVAYKNLTERPPSDGKIVLPEHIIVNTPVMYWTKSPKYTKRYFIYALNSIIINIIYFFQTTHFRGNCNNRPCWFAELSKQSRRFNKRSKNESEACKQKRNIPRRISISQRFQRRSRK